MTQEFKMIPSFISSDSINRLTAELNQLKAREYAYLSQIDTVNTQLRESIGLASDLISCKLKIVQTLLSTPESSRSFTNIAALFQSKIAELKQDHLTSYTQLLEQRTHYLKEGQKKAITPQKKEKWRAKFSQDLDRQISEQTLSITASTPLEKLQAELEESLKTQIAIYQKKLQEKQELAQNLETLQNTYQTKKSSLDIPLNLWTAAEGGHLDFLKTEVKKWWFWQVADQINVLNISGCTPLLLACAHSQEDTVRYLLAHSANPLLPDHLGYLPLHWAAKKGNVSIVSQLLQAGSSVNALGEYQRTPLHMAAHNGHPAVVTLLLQAHANPNARTSKEDTAVTPCHEAVMKGHLLTLQALLQSPTLDVTLPDQKDRTPLYYAVSLGFSEMVDLLLNHPSWKRPSDPRNPNHPQQLLQLKPDHQEAVIKASLEKFQ